jgi:hypothetical protein
MMPDQPVKRYGFAPFGTFESSTGEFVKATDYDELRREFKKLEVNFARLLARNEKLVEQLEKWGKP